MLYIQYNMMTMIMFMIYDCDRIDTIESSIESSNYILMYYIHVVIYTFIYIYIYIHSIYCLYEIHVWLR